MMYKLLAILFAIAIGGGLVAYFDLRRGIRIAHGGVRRPR